MRIPIIVILGALMAATPALSAEKAPASSPDEGKPAQAQGTDVRGESGSFESYLNDHDLTVQEQGLRLLDVDPDTRVVAGDDNNATLSLIKKYEKAPLVE